MSDSIVIVLIFYGGFILSLIIGSALFAAIARAIERRQKPKVS